MDDKIHGAILCDAAASIHADTLIIIDPTDIQKEYAERMPSLAKVWDGVSTERAARACEASR